MTQLSRRITRSLAGIGITAAALSGGLAGTAAAAPAAPQAAPQAAAVTYTETSLNLGLRLTVSGSGSIIATDPVAGDVGQRWIEPERTVIVGGVSKLGYELRPSGDSGRCITDVGANLRVKLQPCNNATTQVWQWVFRRNVDGKNYQFWINAQTNRKITWDSFVGEGAFPSLTVIASTKNANPNTALEATQLWTD